MRFRRSSLILLAVLPACAPRGARAPTPPAATCLALPGAARASLRLGPGGTSLYWYEQVPFYGYSEAWPRSRVARWDLGTAAPAAVTETMGVPFRVLPDGGLVGVGEHGVVVWRGGVAELVSEHDAIDHLELIGDVAIYAAAGALWRQPLHRATAARLTAADALIGIDGDSVVFWRGDAVIARHVATGVERTVPAPAGELVKTLGGQMIVRQEAGLALQPLTGGPARVVLPGTWRTQLAPDGVRAWRKVGERVEVALVTAAGAERVPDVVGGDNVIGFVQLADGRVAYLVGHDVDGDGEVTTGDEHDLCVGAAGQPLVVTPRAAPRRWLAAVPALDRLAAELGARDWHFASSDALPGVTFRGGAPTADRARRWADARTAGAAVAAAIGDPTLNVVIEYEDGGRALAEWEPRSGRRVSWAGTGGALVPDPTDYEVELVTDTLARADDGLITCAGAITNKTDRALTDLVIDCVGGDADTPIPVFPTTVAPGQVARFAGTTAGDAGGSLLATAHRPAAGENLLTYDRARVARYERIAAAAAEVVDRTRLTVWDWSGGAEVGVELWAPADFGDYSDAARTMAAEIAYEVLARVDRAAFLGEAAAPLALTIRAGDAVWTYDGRALTVGTGE